MSLEQIAANLRNDKNTTHAYLPLYENLLKNKNQIAQNILEIGFNTVEVLSYGEIILYMLIYTV